MTATEGDRARFGCMMATKPIRFAAAEAVHSGHGQASTLFEAWLQTSLQRRYDETLDEPLPDSLSHLVRDSGEKGRPS